MPRASQTGADGAMAEAAADDAAESSWAAARLERLRDELRSLAGCEHRARRARLRALQLELHPDKHPPQRRGHVLPLFHLVQREWESGLALEPRGGREARPREQPQEQPQQGQRDDSERLRREAEWRRQQSERRGDGEARRLQELIRRTREARRRQDTWADMCEGPELELAECAVPGGMRRVVGLLQQRSYIGMLEAVDVIEELRDSQGWREALQSPQLDRVEAEALLQCAEQKASCGMYGEAIWTCLQRAVSLDPGRADLYVARASCRLRQHFPPFGAPFGDLPEAAEFDARYAVEDCEQAIALDPALAEAYHLALPVALAQGDLAAAERLAKKAAAFVADAALSEHFRAELAYARRMREGLEQARAMLAAEEQRSIDARSPEAVRRFVLELQAFAGPRLEPALRRRLDLVLQSVSHLVRVKEARAYITGAKQDTQWEDAWSVLYR